VNNIIANIDSKKPTSKQELIATNIKLLIQQLEAGQSDALTNYLTAMSRFHSYSFGNVLEIARQMPAATRVAGFWTWKNLGRSVKAGQKGIRILAPIVGVRRKKDTEAQKDITKQNERILLGFRNAYVFDISQTSGVDIPALQEVTGDPGENIERLKFTLEEYRKLHTVGRKWIAEAGAPASIWYRSVTLQHDPDCLQYGHEASGDEEPALARHHACERSRGPRDCGDVCARQRRQISMHEAAAGGCFRAPSTFSVLGGSKCLGQVFVSGWMASSALCRALAIYWQGWPAASSRWLLTFAACRW
jgi:hypothetical protein